MTTRLLRWGIIGSGAIARRFAADLRFSRTSEVVAVASRDRARAQAFAAAIGPAVAAGTAGDVLAMPVVEAVYVATANERHAEDALAAIAAGKRAVLVEKPFALHPGDVRRVGDAARTAGVFCMEALWMRFTPGIVRLRRLVEEGAIGDIVALQAGLSFAHADVAPARALSGREGGGALLDLGIYPVSLALDLLGTPERVTADRLDGPDGAARQASLILRYRRALASLQCGFDAEGANEVVVTGTRGVLTAQGSMLCPSSLSLRRTRPATSATAPDAEGLAKPRFARQGALRQLLRPLNPRGVRRYPTLFEGSGLQYQVDHVAACLAEKRLTSPMMPLDSTAEAIAILRRAMEAAA